MEMHNLCSLRDIYRLIRDFEVRFQQDHELSLNEGMLLCSLRGNTFTSGEVAEMLGLTHSNASKVIKSAEEKGHIKRTPCKEDKRKMYFEITEAGINKLSEIQVEESSIDDILKQITQEG